MRTQDERRAALRAACDTHGVDLNPRHSTAGEDVAPYLDGTADVAQWCAVTRAGDHVYVYPDADTFRAAAERATRNVTDDIYPEVPVAIRDLDTDRDHWPDHASISWTDDPGPHVADDAAAQLARASGPRPTDLADALETARRALRGDSNDAEHDALAQLVDVLQPGGSDRLSDDLVADDGTPDPPDDLADAWRRYQQGGDVSPDELRQLDEWRADVNEDDAAALAQTRAAVQSVADRAAQGGGS
jgi:hypothetical protein